MWFRVREFHSPNDVTHWSCDHVICKKKLSLPLLEQWPPILARRNLSWVDQNHRVTWLIYYVITLYSRKDASPVSRRQWLSPSNWVELWVRVKEPHLLFQLTCLEIPDIGKLMNQKSFLLFKKILTLDSYRHTPFWRYLNCVGK